MELSDIHFNDLIKDHLVYDKTNPETNMIVLMGIPADRFADMTKFMLETILEEGKKETKENFSWLTMVNKTAAKFNLPRNSCEIGFCLGILYKEVQNILQQGSGGPLGMIGTLLGELIRRQDFKFDPTDDSDDSDDSENSEDSEDPDEKE